MTGEDWQDAKQCAGAGCRRLLVSRAVLVDTSVFAYALGGEHPLREPCRDFLRDARLSGLELHASVEMVQELTFHRMRRTDAGDRRRAGQAGRPFVHPPRLRRAGAGRQHSA
ncbi:MAG: type II toxin-antitoxin system VapC family toxin [Candidatus Nanopelagicales bacterium]